MDLLLWCLKSQEILVYVLEILNSHISFQKLSPVYSRSFIDVLSSFTKELFSFCISVQIEVSICSLRGELSQLASVSYLQGHFMFHSVTNARIR